MVTILVSEEGDVVKATVGWTLSREAAQALLTGARSMEVQAASWLWDFRDNCELRTGWPMLRRHSDHVR